MTSPAPVPKDHSGLARGKMADCAGKSKSRNGNRSRTNERNQQTEEVRIVPSVRERPVLSAEEAFELLEIDRGTGYKAIRDGTFPIAVLRVGRLIRVPTAALIRLLQLEGTDDAAEGRGD
jgi:hypothetical protein